MTNEQIERLVEVRTNAADNMLMSRKWSQERYNLHIRALNRWADERYAKVRG